MKFKLFTAALLIGGLLGGCDGSSQGGMHAEIIAKALSSNAADDGADEKVFRRSDGMRIDLLLGLVSVAPVELQSCDGELVATLKRVTLALNPIATAQAHAVETAEGATVIDVMDQGASFDMGELTAKPGTYCGIVLALVPGPSNAAASSAAVPKHGDALDESMAGASINVAPCYYDDTQSLSDAAAAAATSHHCLQAKYTGATRQFTVKFPAPVTLDSAHRHLPLQLVTRYEEWFDGVDMSLLASDSSQQAALADKVVQSIQAVTGENQLVAARVELKVNAAQALCNQVYAGVGSTAQDFKLTDFRFYLSELVLKNGDTRVPVTLASKADGSVLNQDGYSLALLGMLNGCAGQSQDNGLLLSGSAPAGQYEQICFKLGLPFALNHVNVADAASPLSSSAMAWSWLSGHKFLRVDGVGNPNGVLQNYFVHLGSTGCSNGGAGGGAPPSAACLQPNLSEVCLPYADIAQGAPIVADIGPVLAASDVSKDLGGAPGCMSGTTDPECQQVLPRLGLPWQSPVTPAPAQTQQLFSVGALP